MVKIIKRKKTLRKGRMSIQLHCRKCDAPLRYIPDAGGMGCVTAGCEMKWRVGAAIHKKEK